MQETGGLPLSPAPRVVPHGFAARDTVLPLGGVSRGETRGKTGEKISRDRRHGIKETRRGTYGEPRNIVTRYFVTRFLFASLQPVYNDACSTDAYTCNWKTRSARTIVRRKQLRARAASERCERKRQRAPARAGKAEGETERRSRARAAETRFFARRRRARARFSSSGYKTRVYFFFYLLFSFFFFLKERTRTIIKRQLKNRRPLNSPEGNVVKGGLRVASRRAKLPRVRHRSRPRE